jgi:hypothetical protein
MQVRTVREAFHSKTRYRLAASTRPAAEIVGTKSNEVLFAYVIRACVFGNFTLLAAASDCHPCFPAAMYRARCVSLHSLENSHGSSRCQGMVADPQSCRFWDDESGREGLVESVATCKATSSIWSVGILMSSPDDDKRATLGGGVTSAILSVSWATSSKGTCVCVAVWRQAVRL